MVKAIIFDLDGLLIDSTLLQLQASREFLESFGKLDFSSHSGSEGKRIIDIITDMKDTYDLPGTIDELYEKRQNIYFKLAEEKLQMFPGALELMQKFKRKELLLALATSGDRAYVHLVFKKFPQIKSLFNLVVTGDDVVAGKPNPEVYKKSAEFLHVEPAECVVLEDAVNGIIAAKAAGMTVIAVPNKNYPEADYSKADKICDSLHEVLVQLT